MRPFLIVLTTLTILLVFAPSAQSAGLVPCGGAGESACTFCDFFKLTQNIINFSITSVALPLAGLFFLIGAFLIMVSGSTAFTEWSGKGGQELHSLGGRAITGALIGVLIVLAAWLFINELFNFIVDPEVFPLPWNEIQCKAEAPPGPVAPAPPTPPPPAVIFNNVPSPELVTLETCVRNKVAVRLTSETDSNIATGKCNPTDPNESFNDPNNCQHTRYSCHYGGRTCVSKGSYAFDFGTKPTDQPFQTVSNAITQCDSRAVIFYEGNHGHASIGTEFGCGCN